MGHVAGDVEGSTYTNRCVTREERRTKPHIYVLCVYEWAMSQALWRGGHTRTIVKQEKDASKVRKLALFFTNAAFVKCYIIWDHFTQVCVYVLHTYMHTYVCVYIICCGVRND